MPPDSFTDSCTEELLHTPELTVEVLRGGVVESRHRVCAALRFASNKTGLSIGDPEIATFWRSALKPFQALAIVADGVDRVFGLGPEDRYYAMLFGTPAVRYVRTTQREQSATIRLINDAG